MTLMMHLIVNSILLLVGLPVVQTSADEVRDQVDGLVS